MIVLSFLILALLWLAGHLLALFFIVPLWLVAAWLIGRIARKAGYSGWWGLVILVLPAFPIVVWMFALFDWPIRRRVEILPPPHRRAA